MQPITPYEYLLIDVASQVGLDKETWGDRIEWTRDNMSQLEDGIAIAKKPLLFAKAVNALRMVQRGEETNHVIGLDASASGISIAGLLVGCEKTLIQTNLINTGKVQDVYSNLTQEMNNHLDTEIQVARDDAKSALMKGGIYGSTRIPKELFGEGTPELTQFYAAQQEIVPCTVEIAKDLKSAWNTKKGDYTWTLWDGHTARVLAHEAENTSLRIRDIHGTKSSFTYEYMKQGVLTDYSIPIIANIVQSCDACICRELIRRCYKSGFNILTIHDAFYCHPNNVHVMRQHYLDICISLYKMNYLSNIISELLGRKVIYKQWDTNLEGKMRDAEYFLS